MLHLLIDTSTIKSDLISKKKFSTSLIRLEELVKNYGVKILFPQSLQKEWEDHKEKEYKALQKKLNQDKDLLNKINLPNFPAVKNGFEKYEKLMISQIDKFDELLDSAIKIEISDQVKVKTSDHQYNDLAPFKHKKNSVKDAFTIFSAMDFCELNDIHDFFMVSGDVNDFTNQDSQNLKIHDDISNGRSVEINFYENIRDFFDEVEREFDIEFDTDPKYQVSSSDSSESADIILTDQNQPINQQLTQIAQSELFKTLNFIPHHIILKIVPFKSSDRTLFRKFNLETQNQELFDFFSPLGIKEWDSSKTDFKVNPKKD